MSARSRGWTGRGEGGLWGSPPARLHRWHPPRHWHSLEGVRGTGASGQRPGGNMRRLGQGSRAPGNRTKASKCARGLGGRPICADRPQPPAGCSIATLLASSQAPRPCPGVRPTGHICYKGRPALPCAEGGRPTLLCLSPWLIAVYIKEIETPDHTTHPFKGDGSMAVTEAWFLSAELGNQQFQNIPSPQKQPCPHQQPLPLSPSAPPWSRKSTLFLWI